MRIAPVPHFWETVSFTMPGDFGKPIEASFKAKFLRLEQDKFEELMARINAARVSAIAGGDTFITEVAGEAPADATGPKRITDQEVVDNHLLGWDDVIGDDDAPLPYTKDNLARLIQANLGCRAAIVRTYINAHFKAPEKNSAQPPGSSTGG
jgi:hypothetical protein